MFILSNDRTAEMHLSAPIEFSTKGDIDGDYRARSGARQLGQGTGKQGGSLKAYLHGAHEVSGFELSFIERRPREFDEHLQIAIETMAPATHSRHALSTSI